MALTIASSLPPKNILLCTVAAASALSAWFFCVVCSAKRIAVDRRCYGPGNHLETIKYT